MVDTLIRNVRVYDGTGGAPFTADVAISGDRIARVAAEAEIRASIEIDGSGLALAPGFIDAHSHDDLAVIVKPAMLPKLSQGVTTVVVGNCGISAAPVRLASHPPDPMNLLGGAIEFRYPTFGDYARVPDIEQRPQLRWQVRRRRHPGVFDKGGHEGDRVAAKRRDQLVPHHVAGIVKPG